MSKTTPVVVLALSAVLAMAGCSSPPSAATAPTTAVTGGSSSAGASGPPPTSTRAVPASSAPVAAATETNPPGDIPDNQAYVVFSPDPTVSVKVPEGWARTTAGSATVFADKLNRIEISVSRATTAPTVASVSAIDVPHLQANVPKFASPRVSTTTRQAGAVVLLTYQGDSAIDPVTGKVVRDAFEQYSYSRSGIRVDLTLSGPVNADNVDPWKVVSDSVRWTS